MDKLGINAIMEHMEYNDATDMRVYDDCSLTLHINIPSTSADRFNLTRENENYVRSIRDVEEFKTKMAS